jgi:hypothetical protein
MSDPDGPPVDPTAATPPPSTQGGWYQASDGRWYPTHAPVQPGYANPYGQPPYGQPGPYGYPAAYAQPGTVRHNGLAIASLVCSCVGFFLFAVPSVLGVIFGFVARSQIRRAGGWQSGDGMALAGIIIGFAGIALVFIVLVIALVGSSVTPNCC